MGKRTVKDIPGLEGRYAISEDGRVLSYPKRGRKYSIFMKERTDKDGYKYYALPNGNIKHTTRYTHRLLAEVYISNPDNKKEINHIDGKKDNNRLENLEWCDRSHNMRHAYDSGLIRKQLRGDNPNAKLTQNDVEEIRDSMGTRTYEELARKYGVCVSTISNVLNNRNWIV